MRLKNIKLAGFKSFVDPTTVPLPGNLTAIVGPNGCGKSNIIDAVRWVMGESSAKQLRGESLDDVIFTGSNSRKPAGQASIELCFDNSVDSIGGQYASYAEIAIRREITRDGQSHYYLNGTKCRRRDITDLFLGTGLGPRSYAIIEQGMISRLIEAKPEELRHFLEEAAGVSKFKERRRETELRINHTQENLARLNDVREEIGKQIAHLEKQAKAAERYKALKQEERTLKAQIYALRYQSLHEKLSARTQQISLLENQLAEIEQRFQEIDQQLSEQREAQTVSSAEHNATQSKFYELGASVSRIEQTIQHHHEKRQQWQTEQMQLNQNLEQSLEQLETLAERLQTLQSEIAYLAPQMEENRVQAEQSQTKWREAEQALQSWQHQWDQFNQAAANAQQQMQVEQTRIQHVEQRLQTLKQRMTKLEQEQTHQQMELGLGPTDDLLEQLKQQQAEQESLEQQRQTVLQTIDQLRQRTHQLHKDLDAEKSQQQVLRGQQASLEALQQAALGQKDSEIVDWLQQKQLSELPRLAQIMQVEAGWETALETVLANYLQAVCLTDVTQLENILRDLPQANLSLIAPVVAINQTASELVQQEQMNADLACQPTLLSKVQAPLSLAALLGNVYIADDLVQAWRLSSKLTAQQIIVTRDGVCLGNGWLRVSHQGISQNGVLQRERELAETKQAIEQYFSIIQHKELLLQEAREQLQEYEIQRDELQQQITQCLAAQADMRAQQQVRQARHQQLMQRAQQIQTEWEDCTEQFESDQKALDTARENLQIAQLAAESHSTEREQLFQVRDEYQATLQLLRQQASSDQELAHQSAMRLQALQMQLENMLSDRSRLQQQRESLQIRQAQLQETMQASDTPLTEYTEELALHQAERTEIEQQLLQIRQQNEQLEQLIRQLENQRQQTGQQMHQQRSQLEQLRLESQSWQVRVNTLQEQLDEMGQTIDEVIASLPDVANEAVWEEQLSQTVRKIERLGAINLTAIEEFTMQSERKTYLDAQYDDLTEALNTLASAMQKMDRETRSRFKDTFDIVNQHFQTLFPRLFGGGRAYLELENEDVLSAGVTIMAQPPGKRNNTIHLLSGGEKALTAIALVFGMFQQNPAPFCMLDEVDAPLDDANVGRFCQLVKEMSEKVQFIFISHNKLAIEMANHLAGVTMHEAGVSRMVAVDVEQAMAMAEAS